MFKELPKLPEKVAQEFNCIKVLPGEVIWRGTRYDLTKIDVATANRLVDEKFPYLQKKPVQARPVPAAEKIGGDDKDKK